MGDFSTDKIRELYGLMEDSLSQYIFENRLLYSLTEEMKFIRNVVCTIDQGRKLYGRLKAEGRKKGIFGAGDVGRHLTRVWQDIEIECFIDNRREGSMCEGLPVLSLGAFQEKYPDGMVIISTKLYYREIWEQLLEAGVCEEAIVNLGMEYEKLNHRQYFDLPQLKSRQVETEVFIDGGAYDGGTAIDFTKWSPGGGSVIAWEPDCDNQKKCRKLFEEKGLTYELISKGLWNEKAELRLKMDQTASRITEDGDIRIEVDSIDNLVKAPATFIKMDIEGSEYQALRGAEKTIQKYKPRLAICVYHKPEDIWELPWLIHEIHPEYRFYLRHYSFADNETVLYAL